ncbi:hypothetical protein [Yinghuangia sp. YIM S09857]|uniref:phage tail protein n=1 Tax=Yinghuangia sp. YIM S09857 TaxID=3436929 RepID=UPI003F53C892
MKAPHEDRGTPARDGHPPAASRPEPAGDTAAEPVRAAPRLDRRSVQRLASGGAGNRAVAGLVAQRYASVVKPPPARAPGFAKTQKQVAAKKRHVETHRPAATESKSSQDAAVAPPDDKEAQGKAAQAEKMNAAKPGEFDKAAFVKAVNEAIAKQAPKNLDEADKFSDSDKADKVKGEVDGQVGQGKEQSAKDIETTTKAAPDTSKAKEKKVTPMAPDQAPANPGAPDPAGAVPDKQPAEVTDFSEEKKATDQEMADAEVTEDQLKKGNEPQFDDAVAAKKEGEKHSSKAPGQARTAEEKERDAAKEGAAVAGTQAMEKLTATRQQAGKAVDGGKGETKSKDEQQRAQVTAKLQKVFDAAKKDVESTLSGLDKLVDDKFTAGEKEARDAFTADHKKRMKAYKDKRYSGFTGKLKWAKDKLLGMPAEANEIFTESRKLYVSKMQGVISDVADVIGVELGKAKDRIAQGRQELKAEVDKLPADLKKFGEEAAKDFAGKFDDLETQVDEKSQQLVTDLAQKYTDALNKIDEEIKKLQEENKGLWDKVKDAVVGAIKTILELKDMLLGVLAKAASAVMKIIKDPIGFLKNLVSAVGDGLKQFMQNIGSHLKKGLVSWLLGVSASAGIEIPAKFDLKGIIQLIASLLGLTWENLKSRIMRKGVPDEAMSAVETSVPVAAALAKEGPAGAVDEIAADVGDLKATLLEKISSFLIPTVLIAGITWVISLFNPASAFIKAVKAIIDIVTFIVTQGAQIIEFVNTVLDAVIAIADGAGGGVPGLVENALAKSIPVLIGVLAALLGVGGLANKVKSAVQSLSKPVNRAIDKVIDKIAAAGKKIWNKMKSKLKGKDKNRKDRKEKGKDRRGRDKNNKDEDQGQRKDRQKDKNRKNDEKKAKDLKKVADRAAREARAKLAQGVSKDQVEPVLRRVKDKWAPKGLKSLEIVGGHDGFAVQAKVNPESKSKEDLNFVVGDRAVEAPKPWDPKELKSWKDKSKDTDTDEEKEEKKKEYIRPVTWSRGYLTYFTDAETDDRFTRKMSSGEKRKTVLKNTGTFEEAHAEEHVITIFSKDWEKYAKKTETAVKVEVHVSKTPCTNCADYIAQYYDLLKESAVDVEFIVVAQQVYQGQHNYPKEIEDRHPRTFKVSEIVDALEVTTKGEKDRHSGYTQADSDSLPNDGEWKRVTTRREAGMVGLTILRDKGIEVRGFEYDKPGGDFTHPDMVDINKQDEDFKQEMRDRSDAVDEAVNDANAWLKSVKVT